MKSDRIFKKKCYGLILYLLQENIKLTLVIALLFPRTYIAGQTAGTQLRYIAFYFLVALRPLKTQCFIKWATSGERSFLPAYPIYAQFDLINQKSKSVSRCVPHTAGQAEGKILRSPLSAEFWRYCVLSGRTQRRVFASTPERRNGNLNLSKYFISSSGDRTHNQSVLQSHFVPLRHDRRHLI